jgi:hypothetical protein
MPEPKESLATIKWMNCGALMNQFFGNKKTLLFVRERDIQHATEYQLFGKSLLFFFRQ